MSPVILGTCYYMLPVIIIIIITYVGGVVSMKLHLHSAKSVFVNVIALTATKVRLTIQLSDLARSATLNAAHILYNNEYFRLRTLKEFNQYRAV